MSAECCFTSTETIGLLGMGARDSHLNFHTAPELWDVRVNGRMFIYSDLAELKDCGVCVCIDYINTVWQTSELSARSEERATVPDTLLLPFFLYRERNSQQLKTMPHVYVEWPIKLVTEAPSLLCHPSKTIPAIFQPWRQAEQQNTDRISAQRHKSRHKYFLINCWHHKIKIWNRTGPRLLVQNHHTRELIGAQKMWHECSNKDPSRLQHAEKLRGHTQWKILHKYCIFQVPYAF